tara:strand:+ start:648 stop:809 length:162 start_codon:yes stop_codon:yes gene_type:complete
MDKAKPAEVNINYKVPERTRKIIRVWAESEGIKMPEIVIKALDYYAKKHPVSF